ncbi:MAG TPA: hypothetical protein VK629_00810 [Steroidobacteraceae bacterium]|nr:hypothetical protein [Steroidobacteraceae bacterium]
MTIGVNIARIVGSEHGEIFDEVTELLIDCLRQIGVEVYETKNSLDSTRLNILVGATVFLPAEIFAEIKKSARPYVVFQTEVLNPDGGFGRHCPAYTDFLPTASQVWDYSESNLPFLKQLGCGHVKHIPLGYAASLERIPRLSERDIDILFFGSLSPRRQRVLDNLASKWRVKVLFGAYGKTRDQEIARAKMVLNLHQFDTPQLEQIRLSYLLNNKCFVVSERADVDPYDGGVVFCEYDKIIECCETYLAPGMESERERIAAKGYERLLAVPTADALREALMGVCP